MIGDARWDRPSPRKALFARVCVAHVIGLCVGGPVIMCGSYWLLRDGACLEAVAISA